MKKLLTIYLFIATIYIVNAQTKEETISWLKEKFEKCGNTYDVDIKFVYKNIEIKITNVTLK